MKFGQLFAAGWLFAPMGLWSASMEAETAPASPGQAQVGTPSAGTPDPLLSLMNTSNYTNEFTGQASFTIPLGSISNHGGISYAVNLKYYGGGLEHSHSRKWEFNPTSWVGEGFSLKVPYILADARGTLATSDDGYRLSLDGITQLELISEAGNPDFLYPKIRPYVQVTRDSSSLFSSWVVKMPDGSKYHFAGSGAANSCGTTLNTLCLPLLGPLFSQVPQPARAPVIWYLSSIESKDGSFRIFFEYDKIIGGNAEKAVYPKRIFAVNGNTSSSTIVSEIHFRRETKFDAVDNSFRDPLVWFESDRLASISLKNQGDTARVFHLKYQPGNGRTRLVEVREAAGQHERNYYRCTYNPANPWQIMKVHGPSGLEWEYGYTATPVDAVRQDIGIGSQSVGQIGFTGEFNGKYYVQVVTEPNGFGNSLHLKLYEFEHRGSYWKLVRTYSGGSAFSMAPDGSYFAVASLIAGQSYKLRIFNPLAAGLQGVSAINFDDPATYPPGFNLFEPTVWLQSPSPLMPVNTPLPNGGPQIYAFNDWLAIYRHGNGVIRFFNRSANNSWSSACPEYGASQFADPYVLPPATNSGPGGLGFERDPPNQNNPCWAWKKMMHVDGTNPVSDIRLLEVRQGDNFIAVVLRNVGADHEPLNHRWTNGGAIRIFAKIAGAIKWVDPGNTLSIGHDDFSPSDPNPLAKGLPTWGSRTQRWSTQQNALSLDVSVHGDLVGVLVRRKLLEPGDHTSNMGLHVFSVDLNQNTLRNVCTRHIPASAHYVYYGSLDNHWSMNDSHIFLGRNFLLHKRRKEGKEKSPVFRIEAYHFDRLSGQTQMKALPEDPETTFHTAVKIMNDYFFIETVNGGKEQDVDLFQAYRQALSGTTFPTKGPGKLYRIRPKNGSAPFDVERVPVSGLNQFTIHGDRFLAYNNAVGAKNYVYGRFNEAGIISEATACTSCLSILSPNGVLEFNRSTTASQMRFHDDFKGSLSPTTVSAVQLVKISTKGASSNIGDGSTQSIQFQNSGAIPHYNVSGRVSNFRKVKRVLIGPSSEVVTEYASDFEGSELAGAAQTLHGMPLKITVRPGSAAGRQPGETETQTSMSFPNSRILPEAKPYASRLTPSGS